MKNKKQPKKKMGSKTKKLSPEFETSSSIAKHYGFIELPQVEINKQDIVLGKKFSDYHTLIVKPFTDEKERFSGYLEEKICLIRNFMEQKWNSISMPFSIFYVGPINGNTHIKRDLDEKTFNLDIIGTSKPIAEAMIIETSFVILKDRYPDEELSIEVNSIGDKDSMAKFLRELSNYVKKNLSKISGPSRQLIKKDLFNIYFLEDKYAEIVENAPKSMTFLSEQSRSHFKEVLEFLESLNLPYTINPKLLGSRSYCSETIFEISGKKNVLAIGERYNSISKKVFGKKEIPGIGVAILIHPHYINKKVKKIKEIPAKFYFIQFGFDAKRKSLPIIESMRQAKIPVIQALSKDKLSVQLASAEKMNIPYIIMMGQKEALEDSVVVRHMNTRIQETILIKDLIHYIKKLK